MLGQCGIICIVTMAPETCISLPAACYRRQPLLGTARRRDLFLKVLEEARQRYVLVVVGYVVMPEHVHLLLSEPQEKNLSVVMQALKLGFARRVLAGQRRRRNPSQGNLFEHAPQHIWQKRFYDFNVWTARKRAEKLRYLHENPVRRGLAASPELWRWSSYRAYHCGEPGPVAVNKWDVLKLKLRAPAAQRNLVVPTVRVSHFSKTARSGAPPFF